MRQVRRGDAAYARGPWLAGSLVLVLAAVVLFVTKHDFAAVTVLIGAFLAVAIGKRAG
jgi:hypothetical protein